MARLELKGAVTNENYYVLSPTPFIAFYWLLQHGCIITYHRQSFRLFQGTSYMYPE